MGMPIITPGTGSRDQAITDLIQSVALQETALSHVLNAEGEKMQAIIARPGITAEELFTLNKSVNKMLNAITRLEMIFQSKLELFSDQESTTPTTNTAQLDLDKISVNNVVINVPLTDLTAQSIAVTNAVILARAQIAPGFTVNFIPTDYDPLTGILLGRYEVISESNPTDRASDSTDRTITVVSLLPEPEPVPAEAELAKINVTEVTIAVPLSDVTAETAAIDQAIADAQLLVSPGYDVSFTGNYSYTATMFVALMVNNTDVNTPTGILTGRYTVTNSDNPADTATDPSSDRTINVLYHETVIVSNAKAQFMGGSLLDSTLGNLAELAPATAEFITGTTPGTSVVDTAKIDTSVLSGNQVNVAGIDFDLGDFLKLGAANQYANAMENGFARACAGAVNDSGVVNVGGLPDYPADAIIDLKQLIPANQKITDAQLTFGAINADASFSLGVPNSLMRDYSIGGAELRIVSPLLGNFANETTSVFAGIKDDVVVAGNDIPEIIGTAIRGQLKDIEDILPYLSIVSNTLVADASSSFDVNNALLPLFSQPILTENDSMTYDANFNSLSTDLNRQTSTTIDNLPPNTELFDSEMTARLASELNKMAEKLRVVEDTILDKILAEIFINVEGHITLSAGGAGEALGLDI
ncbi:MAG: choice-of-anchor G family protein, partial [Lachnospiraceae bacterium]|nr:choice-of-anchor G family protein [Lachnospiraceae bacterium]